MIQIKYICSLKYTKDWENSIQNISLDEVINLKTEVDI